ncbi:MAG: Rieske (2Fe-2S) protein [Candidatus Thermochlorobacter sp.]
MEAQSQAFHTLMKSSDLADGMSKLFHYSRNGESVEGFIIRYQGKIYAYINLCPHAHEPIIFGHQSAFNSDKRYIVCREHFAMFNPETGVCVSGPCPIADLVKIEVVEKDDMIHVVL